MRRNLTLEETGVLDLRKFIYSSKDNIESWDDGYFYIPFDWLISQGFEYYGQEVATNDIMIFLKGKFSRIYNGYTYLPVTPIADTSVLASDGTDFSIALSEINVSDNYIKGNWEEL